MVRMMRTNLLGGLSRSEYRGVYFYRKFHIEMLENKRKKGMLFSIFGTRVRSAVTGVTANLVPPEIWSPGPIFWSGGPNLLANWVPPDQIY